MNTVTAWETDEDMSAVSDSLKRDYVATVTDKQIAAQKELARLLNPEMAPAVAATIEEYLTVETARNKANTRLFAGIMWIAFGRDDDVSIGHHLSFAAHGDLDSLNEVPSADTLIFDHRVMTAVFGSLAVQVMQKLASLPCPDRDAELKRLFESRDSLNSEVIWG